MGHEKRNAVLEMEEERRWKDSKNIDHHLLLVGTFVLKMKAENLVHVQEFPLRLTLILLMKVEETSKG